MGGSSFDFHSVSYPIVIGKFDIFGEEVEGESKEVKTVGYHPRIETLGSNGVIRGYERSNLAKVIDTVAVGSGIIKLKGGPVRSIN